jgi:site-specific recombinase XerD
MTITPILWTYDELKDGTYQLKIRHSYVKDKRKIRDYYPMNVYLTKGQWDEKNRRAKLNVIGAHSNASTINLKILEIETLTEKESLKDPNVNIGQLIESIISPKKIEAPAAVNTGVCVYFKTYVQMCKDGKILRKKANTPMTSGYLKTFNTTRTHLEAFELHTGRTYHFNDITEEWHNTLVTYLRNEYFDKKKKIKGMAENTISKDVKNLKTIMRHAMKKGKLHTNADFEEFSVTFHDADNIALTQDEIKRLLALDTEKEYPHLKREQERFSLAYNFLLRFNDSIQIDRKKISIEKDPLTKEEQGYFKMTTGKTKEEVIIPVFPRNLKLLKQYNFKLPPITNKTSNENLKMLGLLAKINENYTVTENRKGEFKEVVYKRYELITTHTSRRSAATNLFLEGFDLETIRILGGWRDIKQLRTYLKIDKLQNAKKVSSHPFFKQ